MSTDPPWTIGRLLDWTTKFLDSKGAGSAARLEAQLLLAHALGCSRTALYTRYDEEPTEVDRGKFRELVQQRAAGTPVAHLLGRKEFFSLEFDITPDVLVPRPDTEWVVTETLTLAKGRAGVSVLDLGTGSGCIAIAIAQRQPDAAVTAVDLSPAALAVARRNAEKHRVTDRVRFLEGDLFAPVPPGETFDFIVSNPPYIRSAVIAELAPEVRDHEPRQALDGGPDGFAVIDRLIAGAAERLAPGGYLIFEIGFDQEAEARTRLERHGGYEPPRTAHDLAGHPRVLVTRRGQ